MSSNFTIPDNDEEDEALMTLDIPELFRKSQEAKKSVASTGTQTSVPTPSHPGRHFVPGLSHNSAPKPTNPVPLPSTSRSFTGTPRQSSTPLRSSTFPTKKALPSSSSATLLDAGTANARELLIHPRQAKNPVLKYIENCRYKISDQVVPDFVFSPSRCAIFISLKYHTEHPGYLESRFRNLPLCFQLRITLCFVDRPDSVAPLQHISKLCLRNRATLICVWSNLEAARYLETFKVYENKPADAIMTRVEEDYESRLADCMTSIRTVNRRDVRNLATTYGTLKRIIGADMEELAVTEGLGTKKVKDIYFTFHKPFKPRKSKPAEEGDSESQSNIVDKITT